jgi:hypothetical protein
MGIGRVETVQTEFITIGWGNGLMKARELEAKRHSDFVGFFTEVGRNHDLDEAMKQAGIKQIEAQHPRDNGSPLLKIHWNLGDTLRFYPVTQGPPATSTNLCLSQRLYQRTINAGIGLRWPEESNAQFGVIGYLEPLIQVGYIEPVKLATRSLMVDWFLRSLVDHVRVAKFADGIVDRQKHPDVVELYELAWLLGPGEQVTFGKTKTSLVTPVVSQHPRELTKDHIKSIYLRDDDLGQAVREKALLDWEAIQEWARAFAQGTGDQFTDEQQGNGKNINGMIQGDVEITDTFAKFSLAGPSGKPYDCVAFGNARQQIIDAGAGAGTIVTLNGKLTNDPRWGEQFQISSFSLVSNDAEVTEEIPF